MVALGPDVIFTSGFSTIRPLLDATSTIPIVFANVVDPVGAGFVASLARPGGTVTGFASYEFGFPIKWLELLKQIAPGVHARRRAARSHDPPPLSASSRPFRAWRHLSAGGTPIVFADAAQELARCRRGIRAGAE